MSYTVNRIRNDVDAKFLVKFFNTFYRQEVARNIQDLISQAHTELAAILYCESNEGQKKFEEVFKKLNEAEKAANYLSVYFENEILITAKDYAREATKELKKEKKFNNENHSSD